MCKNREVNLFFIFYWRTRFGSSGPDPGPGFVWWLWKSVEASRSFSNVPTSVHTCSSHCKNPRTIVRPGEVNIFREIEVFEDFWNFSYQTFYYGEYANFSYPKNIFKMLKWSKGNYAWGEDMPYFNWKKEVVSRKLIVAKIEFFFEKVTKSVKFMSVNS